MQAWIGTINGLIIVSRGHIDENYIMVESLAQGGGEEQDEPLMKAFLGKIENVFSGKRIFQGRKKEAEINEEGNKRFTFLDYEIDFSIRRRSSCSPSGIPKPSPASTPIGGPPPPAKGRD